MSEISKYILTIAGVILISIIIELVLSEGQMNGYIKNILSFFVIAVVIAPLPSLLSKKDISNIFDVNSYEIQEEFIYQNNELKLSKLEEDIATKLSDEGYKNLEVGIECKDMLASKLEYKTVTVDLGEVIFENEALYKDEDNLQRYINLMLEKDYGIDREIIVYAEI